MKLKINDQEINLERHYVRLYPKVKAYVMCNSGNEAEAKDIFQEALLAAWLNANNGKFHGNEQDFDGYIYQIAKHKWLDQLKSKYKKATTLKDNFQPLEKTDDIYQETDCKPLLEAVSNLGEPCKRLLQLFYYEQLSLQEIGQKLGYNANVTKTKKYRCMLKLREIYLENYDQR